LLVLLVSIAACTATYIVYSQVLGRIDGLPQLPLEFYSRRSIHDADVPVKLRDTQIDQRLQRAFGPNCVEVNYNHRLELQKNGVILATNQLTIEPDGRCKLKPFSIAVVKDRGPNQESEISTIHCDEAFITFDEPVKSLADMGKRKIVGCDLTSDPSLLSPDPRRHRITCQNNRSTADPNDDLIIETTGPVKYRELPAGVPADDRAPPHIQTTAAVRLTDRRGQPRSTTVTAQGMCLYLTPTSNDDAAKAKTKAGTVAGVRKVVLPQDVTMNLWIDPQGGFLASARPETSAPAPPERTNVQITTAGAFTYEIGEQTDLARFAMKAAAGPNDRPGFVQVVRPTVKNDVTYYDRLDCETLDLQFNHAKGPDITPGASKDTGGNLQWVRARGQYVVLTSQAENMQAHGTELYHDAITKQTTLRGSPEVVALKDGHEIHAPELVLVNSDAKGQEAIARGRGYFKGQVAGNNDAAGSTRTLTAHWRDKLHYRKEEGQEVITLIGAATVEDPDRKQSLGGEQIKLTLAPNSTNPPPDKPGSTPRVKPRRLEVTGRVTAQSPELNVRDTEQLVVLFKDVPARAKPNTGVPTGVVPLPANGAAANPGNPPVANAPGSPQDPSSPPKPPLILVAKSIQAFMAAPDSGPTELDTVNCEGAVHVHQDPTPPQEKPVDMRGDTLQLTRLNVGHRLEITGDPDRPAEVHLPEISLLGPIIIINQDQNDAEVKGPGTMRLVSTTDLQGNKLAKPTDLLVSWRQEMYFNGTIARFQGHIQASQDNTRLLCDGMEVTLDQEVKLNQTASEKKPGAKQATIAKVVCETTGRDGAQPVSVVDSVYEIKNNERKMVRYQRIESRRLDLYKLEGKLEAPGPGEVRILQLGPKDLAGPVPPPGNAAKPKAPPGPPEEEMKLTWVRYDHKLSVFNEQRLAIFWKNVEVLHLPADTPALHENLSQLINRLPPRALYLKCDLLKVYSEERGAKKNHVLRAEKRATVQFDNFYGQADVIVYNEEKQQVIFEGSQGQPAVLSQLQAPGQKPKIFRGYKFTYNRLTGKFDGNDVISISDN